MVLRKKMLLILCEICVFPLLSLLQAADPVDQESKFIRGDVNMDGTVSLSDIIFVRRYLFVAAYGA